MNYYGIVSFFNGIATLCISAYFLAKSRQNSLHLSFACFTLPVGFWSVFYAVWQIQTIESSALFWIRLTLIPCYYIPFAFLWFVHNLVQESLRPNQIWKYLIVPTFFSIFGFTSLMIPGVIPRLYFPYWPVPGLLMHFCVLLFNAVVFWALYLLCKAWRKAAGTKRRQLRWVTFTTLFIWAGGLTNWFLWYNIPIPPIPNFSVAVFFLLLAHAIIRQRLFDVDTLAELVRETKLSAVGTLAASINHEIRNPLYVIKGLAESHLANLEGDFYKSKEQVVIKSNETSNKTIQQADRAMDIIKRFSLFAKQTIDSQVHKQFVGIKETIDNILPLIRYELELDKIELIQNIPTDFPKIQADPRQLEEIFFNLIVNACQAMKEQGGKICIEAKQNQNTLIVTVEDNGPGIPQDRLHQVFEPFYTTKAEGTGLGLYVTKQLVEKNGGRMEVKSEVTKGTKFLLEFPQL